MFRKRSPRLYANDLNRFKLELGLNISGSEFFAILGDISREGLCAIIPMPGEGLIATEINADVTGVILGTDLREEMRFEAKVAWQDMGDTGKGQAYLLGLEFQGPVTLPRPVLESLDRVQT